MKKTDADHVIGIVPDLATGDPTAVQQPDEVLARQLRNQIHGVHDVFEVLVRRHKRHILADCRHMIGSADDAEDLAQEIFIKAFCNLWSFRGQSKFRSWLQRIKVNHCIGYLRQQKKGFEDAHRADDSASTPDGKPTPEDLLVSSEGTRDVHLALAALPDTLRVPLVMCDMDGFSYPEIAAHLGIGLSATKMRIKRGRDEFRRIHRATTRLEELDD